MATEVIKFQTEQEWLDRKAKDLENLQSALHQRELAVAKREENVKQVLSQMNATMKG